MRRTLPAIFLIIAIFISTISYTRILTFIGSGEYYSPSNWAGGVMPASRTSDSIIIAGNAYTYGEIGLENKALLTVKSGYTLTLNGSGTSSFYFSGCTVYIEAGGVLNIFTPSKGDFGKIKTDGICRLAYNIFSEGNDSIIVNGRLEIVLGTLLGTYSPIVINNGGVLNVDREAYLSNYKSLTINDGGRLDNDGEIRTSENTIVKAGGTLHNKAFGRIINDKQLTLEAGGFFINDGQYKGTGAYIGNFENKGILAPGNSPGIITLTGDYSPTSTAKHDFEVGGTAANQFDILNVSGNVNLNGTLNVSLINGFTPSTNHELTIITGTINGTFTTVNIPSSYILIYNANSVVLKSAIVLPVSFKNIDVKKSGNNINIKWQIENEEEIVKYEVEKSNDGTSFNTIGSVAAMQQSTYYFSHISPQGKTFYRIKSIDMQGKSNYSSIVNYNDGFASVVLRAIIYNNQLSVLHGTAGKSSIIQLISTDGMLIQTIIPKEGMQQTYLNISGLTKGVYILSFQNNATIESIKFAIR